MCDKYENRPDKLKDMCYADFATTYDYIKRNDDDEESDDALSDLEDTLNSADLPDKIKLNNNGGKMNNITRPCVMRYHKVSKLKDSEQYYMILLQLYMPWVNEDNKKGNCATYEEKFNEVELVIKPNILRHDVNFEKYDGIDPDDLPRYSSSESEPDDEDGNDFGMIHPDLIDLDYNDNNNDDNTVPVPSTTVENISMSRELFYDMGSKLNERQLELFNFISKHTVERKLDTKNGVEKPDPFRIFLSGGAGVGKSFLVKVITEQLKRILKEPGQNYDEEPPALVTASTGKAATNIDGTTLHSAILLPIYGKGTYGKKKKLIGEEIHKLRLKYKKYLQVLLIGQISTTGDKSFDDLNQRLQEIKENYIESFGGVFILLIGDFFQLTSVKFYI